MNSPEITDEQISRFYSYQKSSCPGLNFNVGEIHTGSAGSRYFFVLRFEIDFRPFAGFGIWKLERDGKLTMIQAPSFELVKNVRSRVKRPEMLKKENKFWLYWEYVCSRGTEVSQIDPNFKEFNEAYLSLFNDVERQRFIDQAVYSLTELKKWLI